MPKWLANLPSNYTAQMALMGWFLTLTSKLTGCTIPEVGVAPGGKFKFPRDHMARLLMDMETMADAMAAKKNWDRPQYAILKKMYFDLKRMLHSFRANRSRWPNHPKSDTFLFRETGNWELSEEEDGSKGPADKKETGFFMLKGITVGAGALMGATAGAAAGYMLCSIM